MVRLFLIISLIFFSTLDACRALEAVSSLCGIGGGETYLIHQEPASRWMHCAEFPTNADSQNDSCDHCQCAHAFVLNHPFSQTSYLNGACSFGAYTYYLPTPFYKTVRRPPKA